MFKFISILSKFSFLLCLMTTTNAYAKKAAMEPYKMAADAKLSTVVKSYSGSEGLKLFMVRVLPESARQFLVLIEGTEDKINGKVLLHKERIEDGGRRIQLETVIGGEGFWTVTNQSSTWGDELSVQLTGNIKSHPIHYNKKIADTYTADKLLEMYKKQLADGSLAAFQK